MKTRQAELERTQQKLRQQTQSLTQLAEQLRTARIAAETANQAKSRFLAHMSHELRTPLNAILGFADVIRQHMFGEISPSRYRDYAQYIHESGSHLLEMINDVLDLSKIEAGKFELKIETLDARALAQSGSKLVAGMAKENGVNLILDADICSIIHGDSRAVKQIIINLLSNGVKFTPKSGFVTLQINEIGILGAEIVVTDTGIGMSKDDIEKALDPFGQIDGTLARRHRGTGLGLPLVKNLAEMQKGFITIDSAPSRGTRVAVFLPNPHHLITGMPSDEIENQR
jgi:signal transduction histidine kinase